METFSALLAICAGNSPVTGEFLAQRPVTWSFDVFFDLRLNKLLSKQQSGWWFQMPSCPLWRHCNDWSAQNPLPKTIPTYCQLDPREQNSTEILIYNGTFDNKEGHLKALFAILFKYQCVRQGFLDSLFVTLRSLARLSHLIGCWLNHFFY